MTDVFSNLQSAAHAGAFGMGSTAQPTPAQIRAGNYAKGSFRMHGLRITIETPMFQSRRGKEDGQPWSITCMAHYGYVNGTKGADGDAVDVFVGPAPESLRVFVINQNGKSGAFDEHKVMLGFIDEVAACTAYMNSYEKGWTGLGSVAACTIKQFKYWLKHGDLSQPLPPELPNIPKDEALSMTDVFVRWGADNLPVGQTVGALLYDLRRADTDGLMFDSATMADISESLGDDGTMLDAMVIEYKQFERKAGQLLKVMQNAGGAVQATAVEVSKPFKNKGTTQVAMLFGMSDGQSVSVFFHNPDSTPNKLMPADELISWKWVQNKKDITAVVAPESGQDLNPRIVARRIMALIQKNSAKFIKANEGKAARTAALDELKASVEAKTGELASLDAQISDLTAQLEQKKAVAVEPITPEPDPESEPAGVAAKAEEGSNSSYMASTLAKIPAMKAEIESLGGLPLTEAEFMERVNAGENQGFSVAELQSKLADAKAQLAGVQAGRVTPRSVVGKGGTKKGATAWLNNMIAEVETALASDGYMYAVNVSNFAYNLNAQLRELKAKAAEPVAPVSVTSTILEDYADVAALGTATVLSVGSENVYFDKDGKHYMTKLLNTDDYESHVGEVVDLSGVLDPYAAPAVDESPAILHGPAGPVTVAKTKYVETGEWGVSWASTHIATAPSKAEGVAIAERVIASGADNIADMRAAVAEPEAMPKSTFLGATLVWSEGSHEENKDFATLAELDSWFKATFSPAQMDNQSGSYYKNKLVIRSMDEAGTKREDTTRVDVSRSQGDFDPARQTIAQYLSEQGFGAFSAGMTQIVEAAPAPKVEPEPQAAGGVNVDDMKAVMTENVVIDVPDGWLVMNAPRPMVGQKTLENGEFLTGRFYGAVDPSDTYAASTIETNRKLDAAIVMQGVDRATQMAMALVGNKYRDDYLAMPVGERYQALSSQIKKLYGKPYGELKALMAQAKTEPAPVAVSAEDEDTGTIEAEGRDNTVKTAKGTKVVTGFKVIEAKNLVISHETDGTVNPDYPAEIQPRDRARTTSQAWVQKTARNLDPDSLGRTQRADSGAPIVGADRVVESGNGRAMAIREAYRIGQADEYREWLVENAEYFGVDVAKIQRMKAPVLVRVRKTAVDRVEFAVESNQDDKLAMTATEKARSDAKRLDTGMLAKLADGDLNSAANRDFVAAFLQSLGDAEAAQYLTTDGKPTSGLISRLQAALFAGAYSDDRLLEMTADQAKPEIANIVSALNSAAPDFMRAKEQDRIGAEKAGEQVTDSLELSLNQEAVNAIIGATNVLRQAKEAGMGLDEFLRQGDMFGGTDPAIAAMAVFISANNRSAKRMSTAFKAMAQFVESENIRKQTASLFGDEPASFTDIVGAANRKLEQEYGEGLFAIDQGDMFNQPTPTPEPEPAVIEPEEPDDDDALQKAKTYLDDIIGGTTDLGSPGDVLKELEQIYAAYGEDKLSELFVEASDAFRDYALKATAGAF